MNPLLTAIWGNTEGYRCVVSGKMKHEFFETNTAPIPTGKDVWFAPSIFAKAERKIENVISSKAFYLDIDCKEGKYANINDAVSALKGLIDSLVLPVPTIVISGNGIHVYWILDRHVRPDKWHPIAKSLRLACIEHGLDADHSITSDIARILRVPGTKNYKDPQNPKPVTLETPINTCTYEQLDTALEKYIFQVELADEAKEANKQFGVEYAQRPKSADRVADGCNQLREFRSNNGRIPEPQWHAGLGVLAFCEEGAEVAKKWSSGHPDYSEQDTEQRLERTLSFGPTTCGKFADVNPDGCKACPYKGKITSPIQLGETVTPLDFPKKDDFLTQENAVKQESLVIPMPPPLAPEPYEVGKEGVFLRIKGDDETIDRQRVMEHPLWVSRLMVGEDGTGTEIELCWVNAEGKRRSANIKLSATATPQVFDAALKDLNVYFFWEIRAVLKYINASVSHVAKTQREETVYAKFGFTADGTGFVIGNDLIQAGERQPANISARIDRKRVASVSERGTLEGWRDATRLLDKPAYWMHRFTVLACLGSPLLALSGNEGSILSLAGESGSGKTTTADLGISAYGNPKAFTIDPQSTLKAFYEHWRQAGNLPVVINEANTIKKEYLNLITLAAANGKARDTMTQDSRLNHSGEWQTLTIFTSNFHMLEMSLSVIQDAGQKRILELTFGKNNCLPLHIGRPINALLEKNHGIAGRLFLDFVMANADAVRKAVLERVEKLEQGIDSVHRYNVWLIAAASVAGDIAKSLDLIDFEITDAIENTVNTLKQHALDAKNPEERISELLADYTNEFQRDIGTKVMTNNAWLKDPFGNPRGRYNSSNAKDGIYELCLAVRMFKDYAFSHGIDAKQIKEYMNAHGAKESSVRLSGDGSGAVWCYVMPYTTNES